MRKTRIFGFAPLLLTPLFLFSGPLAAAPLFWQASSPQAVPVSRISCGSDSAKGGEKTAASLLLDPGGGGVNSRGLSMSSVMAAGILGNLEVESGFSPTASNGSHFGIAQWDGGRWARLLHSYGNPYLLSSQIGFIFEELSSDFHSTYLALKKARTPAAAAAAFALHYEICSQALMEREEDAAAALSSLSTFEGGSCSFSSSPAPTSISNYSWMCSGMGVCKAGEFGEFDWQKKGGYQCYWYWLTREVMLHGKGSIKNPGTPDAGSLGIWRRERVRGAFGRGSPLRPCSRSGRGSGPPFGLADRSQRRQFLREWRMGRLLHEVVHSVPTLLRKGLALFLEE